MTTRWLLMLTAAAGLVGGAVAAYAHHAFAAEFDREQPIEITGSVTKVEWFNPHARFYIDAPDPDRNNEVFNWNFELGSPNGLMRRGWRRDSLKIGDVVTVTGWRARKDPHVANARTVINADGERMFGLSSAEAQESAN